MTVALPDAAAPELLDGAEPRPPEPSRRWPALFGEKRPPAPPEPPPPASASQPPPVARTPPLSSLGYELKGVARSGGSVWAIVSHPAGGRLLRAGDELEPGLIVTDIVQDGVWIGPGGDDAELLGFPE